MKVKLCFALLALMVVVLPLSLVAAPGVAPANARVAAASARLPLSFEPTGTAGQYLAHSGRYSVLIGATESSVAVTDGKTGASSILRFGLENANGKASLEAIEPLPGVTNYYVGNDPKQWRLGVKNFAKVRANSVYPGVDVVYYGDQRRLEFDFVVAPKADPSAIALRFTGAEKLRVGANGDLVAEVKGYPVRFAKPFAYQMIAGEKKPVAAQYVLASDKAQLKLGSYDQNRELVIDPVVTYATYLGGSQKDEVDGIAVDAYGNAYVTGQTCSPDFPSLPLPITKCSAYVSEIKADGSALVGNTVVIGGSNNAWGHSIAVDANGVVYIVGETNSNDLPKTDMAKVVSAGGTQTSHYFAGDSDAFIAEVSSGSLLRVAYLGGSGSDSGFGVAIDGATPPNVIATGETCYPTGLDARPDFPAYSGFERKVEFCVGFITKLDNNLDLWLQNPLTASYGDAPGTAPAGGAFYFSEYFGGQPPNVPSSGWIASHQFYKGDIISVTYLDGGTPKSVAYKCTSSGTTGASEPKAYWSSTVNSVVTDGTVTWQNMGAPGTLVNATTISRAVAVDPLGDVFVAGGSDSGFIGCALCGDTSYFQGAGAWAAKVSGSGGWVYSTVLGETATDTANAIAVDGSGQAYIAGTSTGGIFMPANTTSFQSKNAGGQDAFVIALDNAGTSIKYAGYLGGKGDDQGNGVAVDINGAAYVVGSTKSADFPSVNPLTNTTTSAAMNLLSGSQDAFVTRIIPGGSAIAFSSYLGGTEADQALAVSAAQNGQFMFVGGSTHSFDFPVYQGDTNASPVLQSIYNKNVDNDAGDAFVVKIPVATLPNIAISPDHLAFGASNVGVTSAAQTVTFANTGNSPITISAVSTTGDYAETGNCAGTSLLTNQSCSIQVTFTPTAAGARNGTLVFTDNGTNSPQSIALTGNGISTSPTGGIGIDLATYAFASQQQGVASSPKVFTVTNGNSASVTITSFGVTGTNAGDFAVGADPSNPSKVCLASGTLASGATCTIAVTFTPAATGARSATLSVVASSNTASVALTGTGSAAASPDFALTAPSTGVTVSVGGTQSLAVSVAPTGGFNKSVSLTCSVPGPATCSVTPASVTLDGTNTSTATVSVTVPAASSGGSGGTRTGALRPGITFGALPFCAALALIGRRRKLWMTMLVIALLGLSLMLVGCGGGGSSSNGGSGGMTPGTYQLTITATYSGTTPTTHTTTVPFTVK